MGSFKIPTTHGQKFGDTSSNRMRGFFFAVIKNRDARYDVGKKPEFLCKDKSCPLLDEDVDIIDSMAFPSSFPKCFSKLTSDYQIG